MIDVALTIIYCEIDNVLSDLSGAIYNVTKREFQEEDKAKIAKTRYFWQRVQPKQDFDILWNYIKRYNTKIISTYPKWDSKNAKLGKLYWGKKYTKLDFENIRIVSEKNKKNYAINVTTDGPNILIDANFNAVEAWKEAGGIGIYHTNTMSTIMQLRNIGFK